MRCGGVDYGVRRVAIAVIDEEEAWVEELDLAAPKPVNHPSIPDSLTTLYHFALDIFTAYRPGRVAVERAITGGSGNALVAAQMAQVAGVMTVAAHMAGAEVVYVAPSSWKKDVCGFGKMDKKQVDAWLTEQHPGLRELCPSQDSVDAVCLALAAEQL